MKKKIIIILLCSPLFCLPQNKIKASNYFDELTKEEKRIIVNKGTERAGSGIYNNHFQKGL